MAMMLSDPKELFKDMLQHVGHKLQCVTYGTLGKVWNVAIECEDCGEVLVDQDNPDTEG